MLVNDHGSRARWKDWEIDVLTYAVVLLLRRLR